MLKLYSVFFSMPDGSVVMRRVVGDSDDPTDKSSFRHAIAKARKAIKKDTGIDITDEPRGCVEVSDVDIA